MSYVRLFTRVAVALVVWTACSERMPGDTADDSTTGSDPTTTSDPPTTSFNPTTTTATDSSAGDATTGLAPTSGEPTTTGTDETITTSTTDATTTTGESTDTTGTTGDPGGLVLDPETLVFFDLPINSIRYAVGGFDPDQQTCVSIIFFDPGAEQHCDDFQTGDMFGFPYVFIVPAAAPPCMEWDYAGNVVLDAAAGCMQLTNPFPAEMTIDMQLSVSGAPFTGTISVASE